MTETPKPFVHTIRVNWSDCDPANIAFTGRIPYFALESIDAWWEEYTGIEWFKLNVDMNIGTPFVHLSVNFRAPITPRHKLVCEVSLLRLGTRSVRHGVKGFQNGVLCFEGEFVSTFVIADSMAPRLPPEEMIAKVKHLVVTPQE